MKIKNTVLVAFLLVPAFSFAQTPANIKLSLVTNIDLPVSASVNSSSSASTSAAGVNLDLEQNNFGQTITSSSQVNTESDLQIYANNLPTINKNVASVETNTDVTGATTISVKYKLPGLFLGLFPVSYTSETTVKATNSGNPEINTGLSLWGLLVGDKNYDQAKINSAVANDATIKNNLQINATDSAKAKVTASIIADLNLYFSSHAAGKE